MPVLNIALTIKSKKLNAKVKWKDREVNETVALPKQPKFSYSIGASVLTEKGNVSILLKNTTATYTKTY
ncbi:hypothetical protein [Rickettsia oklahomensis]|uniref:Uncharacterized protein n=1 Tax=Rickettsia oklahomensis TaxID=3141789 RepID=A0AAU7BZZ4_9RICK